MISKQRIAPCLWFDGQAEEAANFYCSLFDNSRVVSVTPVMVSFELEGIRFLGLNGGPQFQFNEAVSFSVDCKTQDEIDFLWDRLIADGGEESMCGWLKDKYGLSWQIIPSVLGELMSGPDQEKVQRVTQAMLKMRKMDTETLRNA